MLWLLASPVHQQLWYWLCQWVSARCNSIANALELRLSCTNPSMWNKQVPIFHKEWFQLPAESPCCEMTPTGNATIWVSALVMVLRLSCTNPSRWWKKKKKINLQLSSCLALTCVCEALNVVCQVHVDIFCFDKDEANEPLGAKLRISER